ncbi:unnamed protein product, partial [Coregonus sp. 'balchen']
MLKDQGEEFDEKVVTMEMWMEGTLKASCMSLAYYTLMLLLIHHQVLSPPCLDAFQKYLRRLCARPNLHAYLEMGPYTITYFGVRGRCGAVRIMMADQGQEWKEILVDFADWMKGDLKATCVNAYGKDGKEAALIDMMSDGVEDLRLKYGKMIYQEYDTGKDSYIKGLPNHLDKFEAVMAKNKTGFLVGDKPSFADYSLFEVLLNHLVLCSSCLDTFPSLKSFVEKMSARPKINAFLDSDAYKKLPINGNGKQ